MVKERLKEADKGTSFLPWNKDSVFSYIKLCICLYAHAHIHMYACIYILTIYTCASYIKPGSSTSIKPTDPKMKFPKSILTTVGGKELFLIIKRGELFFYF